ncbi:hypothetical protein GUJ93_ZPchr0001g30812 [Zizania palustris]|uniref:Uncharacterized protein n=1 Tax=Zizania palustris TaxID=103762 RepID=A0A8J5VT18_ZIZPA|nr:hypothetical protein GUJ93_ZPchr0001g30812 [Zizania palustris]
MLACLPPPLGGDGGEEIPRRPWRHPLLPTSRPLASTRLLQYSSSSPSATSPLAPPSSSRSQGGSCVVNWNASNTTPKEG